MNAGNNGTGTRESLPRVDVPEAEGTQAIVPTNLSQPASIPSNPTNPKIASMATADL